MTTVGGPYFVIFETENHTKYGASYKTGQSEVPVNRKLTAK